MIMPFIEVQRSYDILKLVNIGERNSYQNPVIHDESKMIFDHDLWTNLYPFLKYITHDSYEHVQKINDNQEGLSGKESV
jgi:hypothetical protein